MTMFLSFLRKYDAHLQWHQHWAIVRVDVTVSAHHFLRTYDHNMALCVHCNRPIYTFLEAFIVGNGTHRRN